MESGACLADLSVLFVDDERDIREAMQTLLELYVSTLYLAEEGEAALEIFRRTPVDLVVTDVSMPKMDGLALAEAILDLSPETPIIIVSAFNDVSYLQRAVNLGVFHYVVKPLSFAPFLKTLEKACDALILKRSRKLSQAIFDHTGEAVVIVRTPSHAVQNVNAAFTAITGFTQAEVRDRPITLLSSKKPGKRQSNLKAWNEALGRDVWEGVLWARHKDGHDFPIWCHYTDLPEGISLVLFSDVSLLMEQEKRVRHAAFHDALTDLPNRHLLDTLLEQEMKRAKRKGSYLALLFIDLDGFKQVNDRFGHDAGDAVLIAVSKRIRETLRDSDIVARLGGDEFVAVVTELVAVEEAGSLLSRLVEVLSRPIPYQSVTAQISASIGVSSYPQKNAQISSETLLRQGDQAMYAAKQRGKNRFHFFDVAASEQQNRHSRFIATIDEALRSNAFALYFQPRVDMRRGRVLGFEALLRWHHPTEGLLRPDRIFPMLHAERVVMVAIDRWVLEAGFDWLSRRNDAMMLGINVSLRFFEDEAALVTLKELLEQYPNVRPSQLELELQETGASEEILSTSRVLQGCRALGFGIVIDDFGTGYASLEYLQRLPINRIKIDKRFVMRMLEDVGSLAIVEASIALARSFRCQVSAEGVEQTGQGSVLVQMGCCEAQGYGIAEPMPSAAVETFLRDWRSPAEWTTALPLEATARTILFSRVEHRAWLRGVLAYLGETTEVVPQLDGAKCHLGHWLATDAETILEPVIYERLKMLHGQLHDEAQQLLERSDSGATLKVLSQQIDTLLAAIPPVTAS